jgi:hypothetical protein
MLRQLTLGILCMAALAMAADYRAEPGGAAPAETAKVNGVLATPGVKVVSSDGAVLAEFWFAAQEPTGGKAEDSAVFANIPAGALLGVARFPARHRDRRNQGIKPGVYTLRYGLFPINGDHVGVEPQRDFLILSPAADDQDTNPVAGFEALMALSRKASGTPHPLVLSFWKADAAAKPGVEKMDADTVLTAKLGATSISIIIVGVNAH